MTLDTTLALFDYADTIGCPIRNGGPYGTICMDVMDGGAHDSMAITQTTQGLSDKVREIVVHLEEVLHISETHSCGDGTCTTLYWPSTSLE